MRKHFLFAVIWSAIAESLTVTRKNKRFFSVNFIALIVAVVLSIPASAIVATTLTGTRIVFTGQWRAVSVQLCGYQLNYEQLVIIDGGKPEWVLTQSDSHGAADLVLLSSCDGYNLYETSSVGLTDDFPNHSTTSNAENPSAEITKPGQIQFSTIAKSTTSIWIRKRD